MVYLKAEKHFNNLIKILKSITQRNNKVYEFKFGFPYKNHGTAKDT